MKKNFSNGNVDKFVDKLGKINWEELNQETDTNNAYDNFYNKIYVIYDACFPMKKLNKQTALQEKPCLTKAIIKWLQTKSELYKRTVKYRH